jgi:integrase
MKTKRPQKMIFTDRYGTVVVYVRRHLKRCKLNDPHHDPKQNACDCPKWLYFKPKNGTRTQKAAGTTSFTEACAIAQEILAGFNPEVAKAREITQPKPGITIEACLELYEAALKRRSLATKYVRNCMLPFERRDQREYENGRAKNISLLDFLDKLNASARESVTRMEQLTSDHLDSWSSRWETNDLSTHTWRGVVNTFFKWARRHDYVVRQPEFREPHRVKAGNRCGHLDDTEIAKLHAALPFFRMKGHAMPDNYAARLGAFIDLGRWGGMALCDIVLFCPRVNLGPNDVLTYRRRKTRQIATVLLDPQVASRLRAIPPEEGSEPDRPFRFSGQPEESNRQLWRARFKSLCEFAGIREVETEIGVVHEPHPQMLRDSFAIDAISRGVSLDNVAKALGHATTVMTQRSYLFWVKKREDHCIEDQRQALARRAQAAPEASPEPDKRPRLVQ